MTCTQILVMHQKFGFMARISKIYKFHQFKPSSILTHLFIKSILFTCFWIPMLIKWELGLLVKFWDLYADFSDASKMISSHKNTKEQEDDQNWQTHRWQDPECLEGVGQAGKGGQEASQGFLSLFYRKAGQVQSSAQDANISSISRLLMLRRSSEIQG